MELKNRGVLVTGGASGLGAACVRLLAQAGAKVVIADLNSEIGETLAAELRGEGAGVFFACANVASEEHLSVEKNCVNSNDTGRISVTFDRKKMNRLTTAGKRRGANRPKGCWRQSVNISCKKACPSYQKGVIFLVRGVAVLQRGAASSSALERSTHAQTALPAPGTDTFGDGWNTMNTIVQTKQGPVEYRIVGQGPVILVLNGGHTNCHSPLGHEQFFLDQGYQLLIPSRPGYGKTPSSVGRTAEAFADILVSFLDLLHLDSVIVVGISAAGPTALQLAGHAPTRVSKLILQNAALSGSYASGMIRLGTYVLFNPLSERWFWAAFRGLARVAPQAALKSLLPGLSRLPPDQVLATMCPVQQQAALAFLLSSRSGSGFLHDIHHHCGDLGRITAPVLIITSKYDGLVDSSHATYAHNHIPQAQLFVSKAESHLMWFSSHDNEIRA